MNLLLWHFILMKFHVCIFTQNVLLEGRGLILNLSIYISEVLHMIKNVFSYLSVISFYFVI